MLLALVGMALGATLTCPAGPDWTRERQQRPPIVEPAPVASVRMQREGVELAPLPAGKWQLDPAERYALVCTYADGSESVVVITGQRAVRVTR